MSSATPITSTDPAAHQARLILCGAPCIQRPDGEQAELSPLDAAMLALLAVEGPTSRQRILALLWPDEPPELVRNRLRQRLFALKRKLGAEAVEGNLTLALAPSLHWPGFEHEAVDRPFLGDADHTGLPELAHWLCGVRERRQARQRELRATEASALEQEGRLDEAIVAAEHLLSLEPCQEHAHRRLMRLHYLRGDRAAALLAFDRCERVLKDEVGAAPSAETLELLAQIESAQPPAPAAATARRAVPATVLRPPRLVGRDAAWAQLQAAWERGESLVIVGEAGMGKTRLLDDLVRALAAAPGRAVQVSARPGDERVPYALLSRLLRGLLALRGGPLAAGLERELARVLPELPQTPSPDGSDAGARARFVGAVETLLHEAVAAGLLAVALDDLHFADAASLEMAQHLAGAAPGLRWLVAYRGAEVSPAARALVDTLSSRLQAEPVLLQPLAACQVAELIGSLGIASLDAAALADALHQRTGGNPLFLLETLKSLLQGSPAETGMPQASAVAALPANGPIGRLIERRIGQLSRDALKLARCAAIAGQDFTPALAARVLELDPLDLSEAWVELEAAQVLRDGAFAHDLIQDAARRSVPEPIARELHSRWAELLQSTRAAPARVAAHWLGAGEDLRAAPHLAQAGRAAQRAMRLLEGFDLLSRARQAYQQGGDADAQCELSEEVMDAAMLSGDYDGARQLAQDVLRAADSERGRALAFCTLTKLLSHLGEMEPGIEAARRALAHALAAADKRTEVQARVALAELLSEQGRSVEAEAVLQPLEPWLSDQGSHEQRLLVLQCLSRLLQNMGRMAAAIDSYGRAIAVARSTGQAHIVPPLLVHRGIVMYLAGRAEDCCESMEHGIRMLLDTGVESPFVQTARQRLQVALRGLGRYAPSLALGEQLLASGSCSPSDSAQARLFCALCYLELGQPARARQLADTAADCADGAPVQLFWLELRADLAATAEAAQAARRAAVEAASRTLAQCEDRLRLLSAWRVMARFGTREQAIESARSALAYSVSREMAGQQVAFQSLLALRLAEGGADDEAARLATDCWQRLQTTTPHHLYRGAVLQVLIHILQPHDPALARTITLAAAEWIQRTAAEHVAPPFRDSFLRRNPVNAALLARAVEMQAGRRGNAWAKGATA